MGAGGGEGGLSGSPVVTGLVVALEGDRERERETCS